MTSVRSAALSPLRALVLVLPLLGSACASVGAPDYGYRSYSCPQLQAERQAMASRIDRKQAEIRQGQMIGAAMTLFGVTEGYPETPPEDRRALDGLSARHDALEHLLIAKNCM